MILKKDGILFSVFAFLLATASTAFLVCVATRNFLAFYISSDSVWPWRAAQALEQYGCWGFYMSRHGDFFPDHLMNGLAWQISGGELGMFFGFNTFVTVFLLAWTVGLLLPDFLSWKTRASLALGIAGVVFVSMILASPFGCATLLMQTTCGHFQGACGVLIVSALLFRFMEEPFGIWRITQIVLSSVVLLFILISDAFHFLLAGPFFLLLGLWVSLNSSSRQRLRRQLIFILILGFIIAGYCLSKGWVDLTFGVAPSGPGFGKGWGAWHDAAHDIVSENRPKAWLVFGMGMAGMALCFRIVWKFLRAVISRFSRESGSEAGTIQEEPFRVLIAILGITLPLSLFLADAVNGLSCSSSLSYGFLYMPLWLIILLLSFLNYLKAHGRLGAFSILLALMVSVLAWLIPAPPISPINALCQKLLKEGQKRGLATYWDAHDTTARTQGKVVVDSVFCGPEGRILIFPWLNHIGFYTNPSLSGDYTFMILPQDVGEWPETVVSQGNGKIVHTGNRRILEFSPGFSKRVTHHMASQGFLASLGRYDIAGPPRSILGAYQTDMNLWQKEGIRIKAKGSPGFAASGPYARLRPGHYRIEYEMEGAEASTAGQVDVCCDGGARVVLKKDFHLVSGVSQTIFLDLEVPSTLFDKYWEFRVFSDGLANFTIKDIRISRTF